MTRYVSSRAAGGHHLYYRCSNRTEEYSSRALARFVFCRMVSGMISGMIVLAQGGQPYVTSSTNQAITD